MEEAPLLAFTFLPLSMPSFRTEFTPDPSPHKIGLGSPLLTLGSCFADTMGQRLQDYKFRASVNPFGVIFNPVSVSQLLTQVVSEQLPREAHYLQSEGLWRHFDLHSDFAHPDLVELEKAIQTTWEQTHDFLQNAQWLLITLGTATVYTYQNTQAVVANCHKVPAAEFSKGRLATSTITQSLSEAFRQLWTLNPKLQVVLTVSPVRHLKDTLPVNSVSKATLRVAAQELAEQFPKQVHYFPAYELVMDDLRDYRFYAEDMLHLTSVAQDYVWEKFTQVYLDDKALAFLPQWASLQRALQHRSRNPAGEAHQAFLRKTLDRLAQWETTLDLSQERSLLQGQLVS
ncbi:MAG TPA: GSCFA family protein [Cytophagales bacterium]|nr:GSCFA family protein [Cytophagales bacterium]HAA23775.1 GSCFA family protein [Cytophagales bacterium]HAP58532.1 GSCFA family protein [Cytophagales bacterium]